MRDDLLYTVGYEGWEIDNFVSYIKNNKIRCIIDVREIPLSRKKGFSKTALKNRLADAAINYIHMPELGSPRDIRQKLKADRNYEYFFKVFSDYISQKKDSIEELYQKIVNEVCCLLCYEHSSSKCHRSIVANEIKSLNGNGLAIKNI